MRGRWLASALVLSLGTVTRVAAQEPAAQDAGPTVEAAVGTAIVNRELEGAAETFPATVGTVYCWVKVSKTQPGTTVDAVWYHSNVEVGRKTLNIGGSPWRTNSSKIIPPDATGDWRVDIAGADGKVLKSVSFKVQ